MNSGNAKLITECTIYIIYENLRWLISVFDTPLLLLTIRCFCYFACCDSFEAEKLSVILYNLPVDSLGEWNFLTNWTWERQVTLANREHASLLNELVWGT